MRGILCSAGLIIAMTLAGGCASGPSRGMRAEPAVVRDAPPGPSSFHISGSTTLNLPASAELAGLPRKVDGSFDASIESKVISTSPLRSKTVGQLEIEIVSPDTKSIHFEFSSTLEEERDGRPASAFDLLGKLIQQAAMAAQAFEAASRAAPTTTQSKP